MKKIKYIFWFILWIWLFFISSIVYAESSIRLNIDKQEIDVQEIVELRVDISLENQTNSVEIVIPGVDDFIILWQSQSQSVTNSNWVISQNFVFLLSLKWREAWDYEIWPINIGNISSNTLDLKITWEQIFIWWQLDTGAQLRREEIEKQAQQISEQIAEEYLQQLEEEKNKEIIEDNATKVVPEDFKDIKKISHISPLSWKNSFFIILFFWVLFILYKLYIIFIWKLEEKQNIEEEEIIIQQNTIILQTDFQSVLQDIEAHYIDTKKEVFYGKLGSLMRTYFDEKIESGLSSKTFWELKEQIKSYPSLSNTYEKIYFPEYNLEQDNNEQRIEIINILKDELI